MILGKIATLVLHGRSKSGKGTLSELGPWKPTHQHKKGLQYRKLGLGVLEADHSDVVIYDDEQGTVWVRSKAEFEDGRFRKL